MGSRNYDSPPLLGPSLLEQSDSYGTLPPQLHDDQRTVEDDVIPETATFGRNLTWASAYIIVISRVIGTGIFATPGIIFSSAGSVGLSLLLWVAGAGIAATDLVVWLEYGCMLPRSGGHKVYLEFTYQHPRFLASTLVAVQAVLLTFTTGNCIVFGKYIIFGLDVPSADFRTKILAAGLLTSIVIIHGCFLRAGVRLQNILGWIKIFVVILITISGLYVVAFSRNGRAEPKSAQAWTQGDLWKHSNWGWAAISAALFKVNFAYAGLNNVNNILNEVERPVRTLKSVAPMALITACLFYVLVNLAYFLVVPLHEIKAGRELIAALFFERVFGSGVGKAILSLAIAISAAGNVMVVTFATARLNQEIARQGCLPFADFLASSRPFNAPLGGLIVHFVPSCLVILLSPSEDVYSFILDLEGYPIQLITLATAVGLLILRRKRPELKRPFKAWLPAVYIRVLICIALLAAPFFPPKDGAGDVSFFYATYAIVGVIILILGVLYWYIWAVLKPRLGGYTIEEKTEILEDGTSITRLVHSKA